jgi:hypothetical protein
MPPSPKLGSRASEETAGLDALVLLMSLVLSYRRPIRQKRSLALRLTRSSSAREERGKEVAPTLVIVARVRRISTHNPLNRRLNRQRLHRREPGGELDEPVERRVAEHAIKARPRAEEHLEERDGKVETAKFLRQVPGPLRDRDSRQSTAHRRRWARDVADSPEASSTMVASSSALSP